MNPSKGGLEGWMIFMNNCELIFKMYQLRQRSQNQLPELFNHDEPGTGKPSTDQPSTVKPSTTEPSTSEPKTIEPLPADRPNTFESSNNKPKYDIKSKISVQRYEGEGEKSKNNNRRTWVNSMYEEDSEGGHINTSFLEDGAYVVDLHHTQTMDTAMQTSGDWEHLLRSVQSPWATTPNAAINIKQLPISDEFEMHCLPTLERRSDLGNCNRGYESDGDWKDSQNAVKETNIDEDQQSRLDPEHIDELLVQSDQVMRKSLPQKVLKFNGNQIKHQIEASHEGNTDPGLIMNNRRKPVGHVRLVNLSRFIGLKPTIESRWHRIREIRLEREGEILSYAGKTTLSERDVAFAQARDPLNPVNFYFQVTLLNPGNENYIAIGLTSKSYPSHKMPGWTDTSVGYHADDGKLYVGTEIGECFGPTLQMGDEVGCGLLFNEGWTVLQPKKQKKGMSAPTPIQAFEEAAAADNLKRNSAAKIFVTLNKRLVGVRLVEHDVAELYPTVGLLSEGATVKVNLKPSIPDIW